MPLITIRLLHLLSLVHTLPQVLVHQHSAITMAKPVYSPVWRRSADGDNLEEGFEVSPDSRTKSMGAELKLSGTTAKDSRDAI